MSDCAYGSNSPLGQSKSITNAFILLFIVRMANNSRLVLVGSAVSFIRVLATSTVVFTTDVREIVNTGTELLHRTLQSSHLRGALPVIIPRGSLLALISVLICNTAWRSVASIRLRYVW